MIAVSNTTPLRYLIAIKQEHLLGQRIVPFQIESSATFDITRFIHGTFS